MRVLLEDSAVQNRAGHDMTDEIGQSRVEQDRLDFISVIAIISLHINSIQISPAQLRFRSL